MRAKSRSLAEFLAESLPVDLRWPNRPCDFAANRDWNARRAAWCREHHVDPLDLIRHDVAAKLADAGLPPHRTA